MEVYRYIAKFCEQRSGYDPLWLESLLLAGCRGCRQPLVEDDYLMHGAMLLELEGRLVASCLDCLTRDIQPPPVERTPAPQPEHPYARPAVRGPRILPAEQISKTLQKKRLQEKGWDTWKKFVAERDRCYREGKTPKEARDEAYAIAMGEDQPGVATWQMPAKTST